MRVELNEYEIKEALENYVAVRRGHADHCHTRLAPRLVEVQMPKGEQRGYAVLEVDTAVEKE